MEWEGTAVSPSMDGISSLTPQKQLFNSGKSDSSYSSPTYDLTKQFGNLLTDKLNQVESSQKKAHEKMRLFAAGKIDDVHDVSVALRKAKMALKLTTMVRSKLVQGYQKLSKMQ